MKISTLKLWLCTIAVGVAFLLGMSIPAQAQGNSRNAPAWGRRNGRPYGQLVRARVHRRNELRRDLRFHQRGERRILNTRLRTNRQIYGNTPDWRYARKRDRESLRLRQRLENRESRRQDNDRGRGRQ
ncbi:MAG: hypothetical protein QOJ64_3556 [Acidobacteriota bacterium]|jgi:hypothetical protein|nr:hypothetical protein [Acidobacteriota bacterium]